MTRWTILTCTPNTEAASVAAMREACEAYAPVRRYMGKGPRGKTGRARQAVCAPLWPGYLFVRGDWPRVLAKAKARALCVDLVPCTVPASLIAATQEAERLGRYDDTIAEAQRFASLIGRTIALPAAHPFSGFLATITATQAETVTAQADTPLGLVTVTVDIDTALKS